MSTLPLEPHTQPTPNAPLTQIFHMAQHACSDTPALPTCALMTATTASMAPASPANTWFSPANRLQAHTHTDSHDNQTFMQLQAINSGGSTSAESVKQHRCSNSAEQASERNIVATAANHQQQQLSVLVQGSTVHNANIKINDLPPSYLHQSSQSTINDTDTQPRETQNAAHW